MLRWRWYAAGGLESAIFNFSKVVLISVSIALVLKAFGRNPRAY